MAARDDPWREFPVFPVFPPVVCLGLPGEFLHCPIPSLLARDGCAGLVGARIFMSET
jgi:hypothetical protein